MVVQVQRKGRSVTGLHIGSVNVRRYFPRQSQSVDIELGHLLIRCRLQSSFWRDEPSISDPRLNLWLESKDREGTARRGPTEMSLIPVEGASFRLEFNDAELAEEPANLSAA